MIVPAVAGIDPVALGRCRSCEEQLVRTLSGYYACPVGHGRLIPPRMVVARKAYRLRDLGRVFRLAGGRGFAFAPWNWEDDATPPLVLPVNLVQQYRDRGISMLVPTVCARLVYAGHQSCSVCGDDDPRRSLRVMRRRTPADSRPLALCWQCRQKRRGQFVFVTR